MFDSAGKKHETPHVRFIDQEEQLANAHRLEEIIASAKVNIKSPLTDEFHIGHGTPFSVQRGFPSVRKSPRLRSPLREKDKEKAAERRYRSVEKKP